MNDKQKLMLHNIAEDTKSAGFSMVDPNSDDLIYLMTEELVEVNSDVKDENGNIAARTTKKGVAALSTAFETPAEAPSAPPAEDVKQPEQETKTKVEKPVFAVTAAGLEVPTVENSLRQRGEVYPFSKLEIGESFHVPVSDKKPNPAKTLTAAVASAQRRFKDEAGNFTRKFVVRKVKAGQKYSNGFTEPADGARIFRVPLAS